MCVRVLWRLRVGCNKCFLCTEGIGGKDVFKCATPAGSEYLPPGLTECGNVRPRDANGTCGIYARSIATALDPSLTDLKAVYLDARAGPGT